MIRKVVLVLALQLPIAVFAGSCDQVSCTGKIKTLYPHGGSGDINIEMEGDVSALNCTPVEGKFLVLKETNKLHSEMYSMLLSVAIAQKDIRVRIVGGSPDCELSYTMLQS